MKLSTLIAGGAVLAVAIPAVAAPRANVAYNDLDFSKSADIATFNTRLEAAAQKACKNQPATLIDQVTRKMVRCTTAVKNDAIAKLPDLSREAVIAANANTASHPAG
jgi:UrcA family protein